MYDISVGIFYCVLSFKLWFSLFTVCKVLFCWNWTFWLLWDPGSYLNNLFSWFWYCSGIGRRRHHLVWVKSRFPLVNERMRYLTTEWEWQSQLSGICWYQMVGSARIFYGLSPNGIPSTMIDFPRTPLLLPQQAWHPWRIPGNLLPGEYKRAGSPHGFHRHCVKGYHDHPRRMKASDPYLSCSCIATAGCRCLVRHWGV